MNKMHKNAINIQACEPMRPGGHKLDKKGING